MTPKNEYKEECPLFLSISLNHSAPTICSRGYFFAATNDAKINFIIFLVDLQEKTSAIKRRYVMQQGVKQCYLRN